MEMTILKTATGDIHGVLEVPPNLAESAIPIVLLIAGSGPTDRDGNNHSGLKTDAYRMLAQALCLQGIASLRYDKRGVGASAAAGGLEQDIRFENYIDDAVSWGHLLQNDTRFGPLCVVGHSEGALIGTVASRLLDAQGFVSISGAGFPAADILETQMKSKLLADLLPYSQAILSSLKDGKEFDESKIPEPLKPMFRASVQPYLISWFRYDPAKEISELTMPVLIIQGTADIQVDIENAKQLAQANPNAQLLIIEGMNHTLKMVLNDVEQQQAYIDPEVPISQELIDRLVQFIKTLTSK